jgi:ribose 5-phosphate isomerase B
MHMNTVIFGSDHAGINLKRVLMDDLDADFRIIDVGPAQKTSCDYPVYARKLCHKVLELQSTGILICGSGIGMCMASNRIRGIRAALCMNEYMARMSRMHNDANVLCLGERIVGTELAKSIMQAFLGASFEGGRHQKRIDLIEEFS